MKSWGIPTFLVVLVVVGVCGGMVRPRPQAVGKGLALLRLILPQCPLRHSVVSPSKHQFISAPVSLT